MQTKYKLRIEFITRWYQRPALRIANKKSLKYKRNYIFWLIKSIYDLEI